MFLVHRRPFSRTAADRLGRPNTVLDEVFAGFPAFAAADSRLVPASDILEDDNAWTLRVELPGVRSEDVQLNVEKGTLSIKAEKNRESTTKDNQYRKAERSFGVFERRFSLSTAVDADRIEASLADGVLSVLLPKLEQAKSRAIAVK